MLTIDEAIQQLQDLHDDPMSPKNQQDLYALQLGIEALKVIKKWREQHRNLGFFLMPGEREE